MNQTTEILSKEAFIDALNDDIIALKIHEREPATLEEAARIAIRLECYDRLRHQHNQNKEMNVSFSTPNAIEHKTHGDQLTSAINELTRNVHQFVVANGVTQFDSRTVQTNSPNTAHAQNDAVRSDSNNIDLGSEERYKQMSTTVNELSRGMQEMFRMQQQMMTVVMERPSERNNYAPVRNTVPHAVRNTPHAVRYTPHAVRTGTPLTNTPHDSIYVDPAQA